MKTHGRTIHNGLQVLLFRECENVLDVLKRALGIYYSKGGNLKKVLRNKEF